MPNDFEMRRPDARQRLCTNPLRWRDDGAPAPAELNLGAVGKGYALDEVGLMLRAAGVRHALLSAGRSSLLALPH